MDGRNILKTLTIMKLQQTGGVLPVGGFSMIPLLVAGDTIRVEKQETYKIGDILVCIDPKARLVVHRIIRIDKTESGVRYITKGDNAVAAEQIESGYCLGKVTEATNTNGKQLQIVTPRLRDKITVLLSRKVNRIYNKTHDPNTAFSSKYNMRIYDMAPDYLKEYVYAAQNYMIQKANEYIQKIPPGSRKQKPFVFTKDFYAMLVNHRVLNVLYPYLIEESGRFAKILKLAKARNLAAAAKRLEWCRKITEAFEAAGVAYVVYKGLVTSYFAYGDTTTRECDDIDFLIDPNDTQKAHEIMNALGFYNLNANGLFRTEEPTEEYPTHLTPYVLPESSVTAELHTALYIAESHTPELLARRQKIKIGDDAFYVLGDIDLYVCQIYITAVDDFGCSNMSYENDPNIFLKLKFRNYLDIALLAQRFREIPAAEILAIAIRYDINFYLYLALDYTCKIFGSAAFLEPVRKLRDLLKEYEELDDRLYRFPVNAQDCLLSPFKMKMNGKALLRLRDAFYMSEAWRRAQEALCAGNVRELSPAAPMRLCSGCVTETIRCEGKKLSFQFEIDAASLPPQFLVAVRKMNDGKYRKQGDSCYDIKFLYFDMNKSVIKEGRIRVDNELPWNERMEGAYRVLNGDVKKCNFTVKIRKKWSFVPNFEMNVVSPKIYFEIDCKGGENPYGYAVISNFLFEFEAQKVRKMVEICTKTNEILKISFD